MTIIDSNGKEYFCGANDGVTGIELPSDTHIITTFRDGEKAHTILFNEDEGLFVPCYVNDDFGMFYMQIPAYILKQIVQAYIQEDQDVSE